MIDHILFIGFGAPTTAAEIKPFLVAVTRGRNIPQDRLDEVAHHYDLIGGYSPYNQICAELTCHVQGCLAEQFNLKMPIYLGMRNWNPYLKDILTKVKAAGLKKGLACILAPHQSEASYDRYVLSLKDACQEVDPSIQYDLAPLWYEHPLFIQAQINQYQQLKVEEPKINPHDYQVLFSAHSIPMSMEGRELYVRQFMATCQQIAQAGGFDSWKIAYQSRSGNPRDPWLSPSVEEVAEQIKGEGKKGLICFPVGFLCDNAEILFDLDIELKEACKQLNLEYYRVSAVMTDRAYVEMWASIIAEQVKKELVCPK